MISIISSTALTDCGYGLRLCRVPSLAYESTAFSMVLLKAIEYLRGRRSVSGIDVGPGGSTSNLVTVLYRDSLIFYAGYVLHSGKGA